MASRANRLVSAVFERALIIRFFFGLSGSESSASRSTLSCPSSASNVSAKSWSEAISSEMRHSAKGGRPMSSSSSAGHAAMAEWGRGGS